MDIIKDKATLTEEELNEVIASLKKNREESNIIDVDYEEIKDEISNDPDLEPEDKLVEIDSHGLPMPTGTIQDLIGEKEYTITVSNLSVKAFDNDIKSDLRKLVEVESVKENLKSVTDISKEENLNSIIEAYGDFLTTGDDRMYNKLTDEVKKDIKKYSTYMHITPNEAAKTIFKAIFAHTAIKSNNAIDIDHLFLDALGMNPSTKDLYLDYIKQYMEQVEKYTVDSNAFDDLTKSRLLSISESFKNAYTFKPMYEKFDTDSRTRKALRRDIQDKSRYTKYFNEFNYKNEKSLYKMSEAGQFGRALFDIVLHSTEFTLDENTDNLFGVDDVRKFLILFFKTCENLNANDLKDSAYMYYTMKNITELSNPEEAKTPFGGELISNIKELLIYIRDKEASFNANNQSR